jgi:pimeloyl-ACP methyl ester carboxylesterase
MRRNPAVAHDMLVRTLVTADGVPLSAVHEPPRVSKAADDFAIVVAHGFTGSWQRPAVRHVVGGLTRFGGVVSFDFRGHGRSGGRSTIGDLEVLDLDAALNWTRVLGYRRVASVGWSMGGSVVIRHAAIHGRVDAVASVSAVSRWYYRGTKPMRRAHQAFESPHGRTLLRTAYRTRVNAAHWNPHLPESWCETPAQVAGRISPIPVLIVHGDRDEWFPLEHAQALYSAAREPKELWIEPGFGHAEAAASAELVARIGEWLKESSKPAGGGS